MVRANQILAIQDDWRSKIKLVTSLHALIARLKGPWRSRTVASRASSAWRLVTASIGLVAVAVYAVTFFGPALNPLTSKRDNLANVEDVFPPPPVSAPQTASSEMSAEHMDVSVAEDARRVQERLADLGFYVGKKDGKWGPISSKALSEFKRSNGLVLDDRWDEDTERSLYSERPHRWVDKFIGGWANDVNDCQLAPITISPQGVRSNAQVCQFKSATREGDGWRVQAICTTVPDGDRRSLSFRLDVMDDRLTLSGRDFERSFPYVRCDPDPRY